MLEWSLDLASVGLSGSTGRVIVARNQYETLIPYPRKNSNMASVLVCTEVRIHVTCTEPVFIEN